MWNCRCQTWGLMADSPAPSLNPVRDPALRESIVSREARKLCVGGQPHDIGEHDFLARIFIDIDHHRYGDEFEGRVIMGAPLWAATRRPTPCQRGDEARLASKAMDWCRSRRHLKDPAEAAAGQTLAV